MRNSCVQIFLAKIKHCCFPWPQWSSTILCQQKLLSISSFTPAMSALYHCFSSPHFYRHHFGPHIKTQAQEDFFLLLHMKNLTSGHHLHKELKSFSVTKGLPSSVLQLFSISTKVHQWSLQYAAFHSIKETSESQLLYSNLFPIL